MPFSDGMVDALDPGRLRLLVAVRRRGSISAAAEVCRMGQPSATKLLQTLEAGSEEAFVRALLADLPPAPGRQAEIVAANRAGRPLAVEA